MLLKGKRPVYGQGAWRNTLLLTALLAVLIFGLVRPRMPEKLTAPEAAHAQADNLAGELARLKMLGHALKLHADEHDGVFPASVADIQWRQTLPGMDWSGLPAAASRFHDPEDGKLMDWLYFAGHTENDPPETILVASPVALGAHGDQRMIVRLDGVAALVPEVDYQRQVAEQKPSAPAP